MRTVNLIKKAVVICFVILTGSFFSNCNNNNNVVADKGEEKTKMPAKVEERICKLVKSDEIKNALAKSKKAILNIYPVKLSDDPNLQDFDLRFIFQDGSGKNKVMDSTVNVKLLETQTDWYIGYLKNKNIPMNKIPLGYFVEMDPRSLSNSAGLSFCGKPGDETLEYYLLSEKEASAAPDTTCKCPPVCCKFKIMSIDTTGKCPPDCPEPPLMYGSIVKLSIEKNYKNN